MILLNIALLTGIALGAWWLTGRDKTYAGESKHSHHLTRAIRSVIVVFLSAALLWFVEAPDFGYGGVPILIILPMCMALVLRSSLSEVFTHGFLTMIDPALHDTREFDFKKSRRYQDAIAHLIHAGRREEAIKLCEELKISGEVDIVTLQNTLEFLGVKQDLGPAPKPLLEAGRLRARKKIVEAEQLLKSLLLKNPADEGAAIMLMRIYAEDMHQAERAQEVLRALEKQPHVSPDHLAFARQSIGEWSRVKPPPIPASAIPPPAATVDEFLAQGSFGTAIERLEQEIKARPGDFELRLKLAEVYAVHCKNIQRAEKIIRQIELAEKFSKQQITVAQVKLKEWHAM